MGSKGSSKGLKRKPAPRFWPINRKKHIWTVNPTPGPHALEKCMPLAIILRELLGFAKTRKECKKILSQEMIYVNGKLMRKDDYPVGLMDVIYISGVNNYFRVIPSYKGLTLKKIDEKEAAFKLYRIENKTVVKNGQFQLNLHDGSNLLITPEDSQNSQDIYQVFATLKINISEKKDIELMPFKKNYYAIMTAGKNIGRSGKIIDIVSDKKRKRRNTLVTLQNEEGTQYKTILNYVFVIGEKKPFISLLEAKPVG